MILLSQCKLLWREDEHNEADIRQMAVRLSIPPSGDYSRNDRNNISPRGLEMSRKGVQNTDENGSAQQDVQPASLSFDSGIVTVKQDQFGFSFADNDLAEECLGQDGGSAGDTSMEPSFGCAISNPSTAALGIMGISAGNGGPSRFENRDQSAAQTGSGESTRTIADDITSVSLAANDGTVESWTGTPSNSNSKSQGSCDSPNHSGSRIDFSQKDLKDLQDLHDILKLPVGPAVQGKSTSTVGNTCLSNPVSPSGFLSEYQDVKREAPTSRARSYSDSDDKITSQARAFLEELEKEAHLTAEDRELMETSQKELQEFEFSPLPSDADLEGPSAADHGIVPLESSEFDFITMKGSPPDDAFLERNVSKTEFQSVHNVRTNSVASETALSACSSEQKILDGKDPNNSALSMAVQLTNADENTAVNMVNRSVAAPAIVQPTASLITHATAQTTDSAPAMFLTFGTAAGGTAVVPVVLLQPASAALGSSSVAVPSVSQAAPPEQPPQMSSFFVKNESGGETYEINTADLFANTALALTADRDVCSDILGDDPTDNLQADLPDLGRTSPVLGQPDHCDTELFQSKCIILSFLTNVMQLFDKQPTTTTCLFKILIIPHGPV